MASRQLRTALHMHAGGVRQWHSLPPTLNINPKPTPERHTCRNTRSISDKLGQHSMRLERSAGLHAGVAPSAPVSTSSPMHTEVRWGSLCTAGKIYGTTPSARLSSCKVSDTKLLLAVSALYAGPGPGQAVQTF